MRRSDKTIAFDADVVRLAAQQSGYSEAEIRDAYDKFRAALKNAVASGRYTNISLPMGDLYLDRGKLEEKRPRTSLGFCRPQGHLLDFINSMKVSIGLTKLNVQSKNKHSKIFSEFKRIKRPIEEIEKYQNGEFEKDNS